MKSNHKSKIQRTQSEPSCKKGKIRFQATDATQFSRTSLFLQALMQQTGSNLSDNPTGGSQRRDKNNKIRSCARAKAIKLTSLNLVEMRCPVNW